MRILRIFTPVKRGIRGDAELMRDLSLRYYHGNVKAQMGRFITAQDVEHRKKEISEYVF